MTTCKKMIAAIGFEGFLILSGLGALGYGIFLRSPWMSFTVIGAIIFTMGIAMSRGNKGE